MSTGKAETVFVCASLKGRILPDTGREKVFGYGGCGRQEHYCRVGNGKDGRISVLCLSHASQKGGG